MWRRSVAQCCRAGSAAAAATTAVVLVPSSWSAPVPGWHAYPSNAVAQTHELPMTKAFDFLHHGAQYLFLGKIMAMADELQCIPTLQWFYTELRFTVPPCPRGETLACYMNTLERESCGMRNLSADTGTTPTMASLSSHVDAATLARVCARAEDDFCWLLTGKQPRTSEFMQRTFVQWYHRADYLVTRYSREKRAFRPDLTLTQVMQGGQERKRRMLRRQARAATYDQQQQQQQPQRHDDAADDDDDGSFEVPINDVLSRDVREAMERESDGMQDVRLARMGPMGAAGRGYRTT